MNILLTGGSGFLGKNFIEMFGAKHKIIAPSSEEMDLSKFEDINRHFKLNKFDAVVHFAVKNESSFTTTIDTQNLIFFKNIQYATIVNGVKKLIVASDASDLSRQNPIVEASEDNFGKVVPIDGYGLGRYLINLLASKDKISTVLRFFNVFGQYSKPENNEITKIITEAKRSKKSINVKRDKTFSSLYVVDAMKIIMTFLMSDLPKGDYNAVADYKTSYGEIAKKAKSLAKKDGRNLEVKFAEEGFSNEYTGTCAKLLSVIPNFKFTSLNTAVTKTYELVTKKK